MVLGIPQHLDATPLLCLSLQIAFFFVPLSPLLCLVRTHVIGYKTNKDNPRPLLRVKPTPHEPDASFSFFYQSGHEDEQNICDATAVGGTEVHFLCLLVPHPYLYPTANKPLTY